MSGGCFIISTQILKLVQDIDIIFAGQYIYNFFIAVNKSSWSVAAFLKAMNQCEMVPHNKLLQINKFALLTLVS